jgi:Trypsin
MSLSAAALLTSLVGLVSLAAPAGALVGAAPDARFADRVAMVLLRGGGEAGFCSALVLDSRTLLTAAHCAKAVRDMAVHYRDAAGAPVVIPVEAAVVHPLYRPDAIAARAVSIDAALIRTARPLDPRFVGATLASGEGPPVGEPVILAGYGVTRDGDWKSGGQLRSVTLAVRAPASTVLIWAADPDGAVAGACSGDSGAPIWSADGRTAIAIAAWAQAPHGRGCGGLTQGPLLAPLKAWIEATERRLAGGS